MNKKNNINKNKKNNINKNKNNDKKKKTGYHHFCDITRPIVAQDQLSAVEVTREVARRWKALSTEQKKSYDIQDIETDTEHIDTQHIDSEDTQHIDTEDTQHIDTEDTQHIDTQHIDIEDIEIDIQDKEESQVEKVNEEEEEEEEENIFSSCRLFLTISFLSSFLCIIFHLCAFQREDIYKLFSCIANYFKTEIPLYLPFIPTVEEAPPLRIVYPLALAAPESLFSKLLKTLFEIFISLT
jgi:hypothetical protein